MHIEGDHVMGPKNLSKETLERTAKFCRNAEQAKLQTGDARFPNDGDYIVFFMTNGSNTIVLYCTPTGYVAEYYEENEDGTFIANYLSIKNIRHFVFKLAKESYCSWTQYNEDIMEKIDSGEIDIADYLELEDEE